VIHAFVEGVGLVGPGLQGWATGRRVLAGEEPYRPAPTAVAASELLAAAERRRTGMPVKLALAAGLEAFGAAGRDAAEVATVFASSGGDCDNVHLVCEALAAPERLVSPTRFHNSVHNAAAGYWSIATRSRAPSTSLCCYDASTAAGLLDAVSQIAVDSHPVALIVYDHPYPEPLNAVRPGRELRAASCRAAAPSPSSLMSRSCRESRGCTHGRPRLEALRASVPARVPALLAALARGARERSHSSRGNPPARAVARARESRADRGMIPHSGAMCLLDGVLQWDASGSSA
jgi:hypothetical protein